jgi:tRNA pseudouridine55 synthase
MRDGILLLDKPIGLSSNAALQRVRRRLGIDKAGHVGSLDPLATGMLPICLGEATKIAGEIISARKRYRFTVALGSRTSTGDAEGAAVETAPVPALDHERIAPVLQSFLGRQSQIPPMYSALKRDGQPLYRLARAGVEVERAAREIELTELILHRFDASTIELETLCSKGTYIRTLAEDIARALGTCGHVSHLRRLYVEPFDDEPMETMESIERALTAGGWPRMLRADEALPHLAPVRLDAARTSRLLHGQCVTLTGELPAGKVRIYDEAGGFLGLGEADGIALVRPRRLFLHPL